MPSALGLGPNLYFGSMLLAHNNMAINYQSASQFYGLGLGPVFSCLVEERISHQPVPLRLSAFFAKLN